MSSISVVIPTYNRAALLPRAVHSAFAQTHAPDEVVIIDDGSQDETPAVIDRLKAEFGERLRSVRQTNRGEAGARNAGVRAAKGDLIAFLDSDDVWFPEKLERQLVLFTDDVVLTFTGYVWDEAGTERPILVNEWRSDAAWVINRFLESCCITPSTTIVRRAALDAAGPFDEAMRVSCDWDMWCRIVAAGFKTAYLPELTARYFWHDLNMSRDSLKTSDAALYIFTKLFNRQDLPASVNALKRKGLARWNMIHAENCLAAGARNDARRHIVRAALSHPTSVRPGWLRIFLQSFGSEGGSPERVAS